MNAVTKKKLLRFAILNGGLLLLALSYAAVYTFWDGPLFGIKICFVRELFHIYCPGCGGSRSLVALLKLQIVRSFLYYPALPYTVGVILGYDVCLLLDAKTKSESFTRKYPKWLWILIPVIIAFTCLLRNLLLLNGIDTLGNFL